MKSTHFILTGFCLVGALLSPVVTQGEMWTNNVPTSGWLILSNTIGNQGTNYDPSLVGSTFGSPNLIAYEHGLSNVNGNIEIYTNYGSGLTNASGVDIAAIVGITNSMGQAQSEISSNQNNVQYGGTTNVNMFFNQESPSALFYQMCWYDFIFNASMSDDAGQMASEVNASAFSDSSSFNVTFFSIDEYSGPPSPATQLSHIWSTNFVSPPGYALPAVTADVSPAAMLDYCFGTTYVEIPQYNYPGTVSLGRLDGSKTDYSGWNVSFSYSIVYSGHGGQSIGLFETGQSCIPTQGDIGVYQFGGVTSSFIKTRHSGLQAPFWYEAELGITNMIPSLNWQTGE